MSHSGNHIESGLERISSNSSDQGGRRLIEWSKAWINFKANPIFGSGWNQFAIVSFDLHNLYPHAEANSGLFVNCHNLILQLLSDTGIIGTTLIIVTIARMLYLIIRSYYTSDNLLCMTILFIVSAIIIHSLNEYPLWYIYFLLPFMLLLGIGDKGIKLQLPHKAYAIILLPIAYVIYQIVINSIIFNNLVDYTDVPDDAKSYAEQANYLKSFESDPLWAYQSAYTLDNYISIDDKLTEHNFTHKQQLENTRRLFTETPYLDTSIKLAKLEYLYGDKKYAIRLIESSYIYYPTYIDTFDDALDNTPALAKVIDKD